MAIPVEKKSGIGGIARVSLDPTYVYVTFEETPGTTFKIFREDVPQYLLNYSGGKLIVTISSDAQKIYSARPAGGTHLVVLDSFVRKDKSAVPVPYLQKGNVFEGKRFPDRLVFDALLRIIYGEFKDFIIPYQIGYAFNPSSSDPSIAAICGTGMKKCEDFLDKFGLDFMNDTIPMSENILPWLEKTLLSRGKKAMVELNKKGFVDTMSAPLEGFDPTAQAPVAPVVPAIQITEEQATMMMKMGMFTQEQFNVMKASGAFVK